MLKPRFCVCSWIGDGMSQIKLTEYQTTHQNANIGGTWMLATQVCGGQLFKLRKAFNQAGFSIVCG